MLKDEPETFDNQNPEAFCSRAKGYLKSALCNHLGWQEGFALGTPGAIALLQEPRPMWFYDRPTALVLEVNHAHPVVAKLLYQLHTGEDYMGDDDRYIDNHMGFWSSSVATRREVMVSEGFKLTAQERMVFKTYTFKVV